MTVPGSDSLSAVSTAITVIVLTPKSPSTVAVVWPTTTALKMALT